MSLRAEKKQNGEVYLMEPIGTDNDGNEISLCDILGTDADHVHNEAERSMEAERLWQAIDDVLSARERTVVKLRYGIPCGRCMAQREVAAILGISRSYVSRCCYVNEARRAKRLPGHQCLDYLVKRPLIILFEFVNYFELLQLFRQQFLRQYL